MPKTTFRIARSEDMTAQEDLDTRAIGSGGLPVETLKAWYAANNESIYHVYHDNKLVAYMFLVPLKRHIIEQLLQERIHWRDINSQTDREGYAEWKR